MFPQQLQRAILEVEQQSNIVFDLYSTLNKTLGLNANAKARRNLLLGSEIGCDQVNHALRCFMVLTAWESNTDHIRDLLNSYRHRAIAKPSLETFSPLTWLRRDLAHLDDALVVAKQNLEDRDRDALEALLKNKNSGIKSLDVQYDALIDRVRAMSTTLNNDIQFVIGSVTVHVSIDSIPRLAFLGLTTIGFCHHERRLRHHEEASGESNFADDSRGDLPATHTRHRHFRNEHQGDQRSCSIILGLHNRSRRGRRCNSSRHFRLPTLAQAPQGERSATAAAGEQGGQAGLARRLFRYWIMHEGTEGH